ncbi:hypothetical protein [Neorhizobium alkalisoli]|uniref:hypothetical protein n=1 Tax=Neorhizobium alkalisoli TaxID=528178 RepID=UPI0011A09447|nr:hypothetical protein [Neorhizobium alkalisoli]
MEIDGHYGSRHLLQKDAPIITLSSMNARQDAPASAIWRATRRKPALLRTNRMQDGMASPAADGEERRDSSFRHGIIKCLS